MSNIYPFEVNQFDVLPVKETSYKFKGDFSANAPTQSKNLIQSFNEALALNHSLPEFIRQMVGMSGRKYRYLINYLIKLTANPRYLEVGSWAGSTACSAIFENTLTATCIDNWSQFEGPKDNFLENIRKSSNSGVCFNHIESDFYAVDFNQIGKYNIYLYDGPHTEKAQYDGIALAQPALETIHTLIVDDWNWPEIRLGTMHALADLNSQVISSIEIRTTQNNDYPYLHNTFQNSEWHNGYLMAVVKKISS